MYIYIYIERERELKKNPENRQPKTYPYFIIAANYKETSIV